MKKYFIIVFVIIVFIFGCNNNIGLKTKTTTGVNDSEIIIGSSSPLNGHASFLGSQLTKGSLCLIKHINENGGINNRKIKLITLDDKYDPKLTIKNTNTLINKNVFMLFNYVGTPTSKKIVPIVNKHKIPILGLFTGAEFLRNPYQPYILNVRASYFMEVEKIIDFWISKKKKKISVFMQNDAFGNAVLSGTRLALSRYNYEIHSIGKFIRGTLPQKEEVIKIANTKPDAIIMVGTYTPLARYVKMTKDLGLTNCEFHTVSFVGSKAFAASLLKEGKETGKGVYVTQVVPSPFDKTNKAALEFQRLFSKFYPSEKINYVAFEGYINAKILIEALQRTGIDLSRERFIKTLENMSDYNANTEMTSDISQDNHNFFEDTNVSTLIDEKFQVIKDNQ